MRTPLLTMALVLFTSPAWADIVHLKNGRTMEGEVVGKTRKLLHLKVPGGQLALPRITIKRVEYRRTPQAEYARRARKTDMNDPAAVERLANWASVRGLGEQVIQLENLAKGLRLRKRVDAIRNTKVARDWVELYHWAKAKNYSLEVKRWLAQRALNTEPNSRAAQELMRKVERLVQAREAARLRRLGLAPKPAKKADQDGEKTKLADKLAEQQSETQALRERLAILERDKLERLRRQRNRRVRARRRRRSNCARPPVLIIAKQPPVCGNR